MMPFKHHIFVCTNRRDPSNPKGSCANSGSEAICSAFKKELADRGLRVEMRANSSGCLDQCEHGPAVAVYPDGVFYTVKTVDEVKEIVEQHLVHGRPVERLQMALKPPSAAAPKSPLVGLGKAPSK